MQTLGISNAEPASENRLKNLFWPTIHTGTDVDTLGAQGYWICAIVAALAFVTAVVLTGQPVVGLCYLIFYYVGCVGVRQRSCYCAVIVFVAYLLDTIFSPGIVRLFLCAILLANVRATFIASFWEPEAVEAEMPVRLSETWSDKFVDKFPQWLWPKIRVVYYIYSMGWLALISLGLFLMYGVRSGLISPELLRRFAHH